MSDALEELRVKLETLESEEARSFAIVDFLEMARLAGTLEDLAGGAAKFINLLPPLMRRALVANALPDELREPLPTFDQPPTSAWVGAFDNQQEQQA